jgi:hypothetical protein
LALLVGFRTLE